MRRLLIAIVLSGIVGFVGGAAFWFAFGPLFQPKEVIEALPPDLALADLARGELQDVDARHKGRGRVRLVATPAGAHYVVLEDFEVTNGPDLKVWLAEASTMRSAADLSGSAYVSLGPLKGNKGTQFYAVPPGSDPRRYRSVVIWCELFGILFSFAPLA